MISIMQKLHRILNYRDFRGEGGRCLMQKLCENCIIFELFRRNCPIRLLGWQGAKKLLVLLENGGRLSRGEFRGGFERDDYYKYEFFNYC